MMNDDTLINEALKEHAQNDGGIDHSFLDELDRKIDGEAAMPVEKEVHSFRDKMWCAVAAIAIFGFSAWIWNSSNLEKESPVAEVGFKESNFKNLRLESDHTTAQVEGEGARPGQDPVEEATKELDADFLKTTGGRTHPLPVLVPASFGDEVASAKRMKIEGIDSAWGDGYGMAAGSGGGIEVTNNARFRRGFIRGNPTTFGMGVPADSSPPPGSPMGGKVTTGNQYGQLIERGFQSPLKAPLSTFSIDVDTASYTNIRKQAETGRQIDPNAVRIEEMINYFSYDYEQPAGEHPFSVHTEVASCPWNSKNRLVKIGLQGKKIEGDRKSANLAFLIDVSGSMSSPDKLPLLVQSFEVLLKGLNESDRVSLVVYAGRKAVLLQPTSIDDDGRRKVKKALKSLSAGGSTNGAAGISTAYDLVRKGFIEGGVNRVILATDGDFNVGVTSNDALLKLVKNQAEGQISLTTLGFGQGNLNDDLMEQLTNNGDGNYFYIDSLREGQKVFQHDLTGTLETIAKDVKIQVEFNPGQVSQYRLIGYANRVLRDRDFTDDKIDAGDIGAGHRVTAFYEIIPVGVEPGDLPADLKYQKVKPEEVKRDLVDSPEMLTVKLRYKQPDGDVSTELSEVLTDEGQKWEEAKPDFKFASSVALWGLLLRDSEYAIEGSIEMVNELALAGRGADPRGERAGFMDLVRTWQTRR